MILVFGLVDKLLNDLVKLNESDAAYAAKITELLNVFKGLASGLARLSNGDDPVQGELKKEVDQLQEDLQAHLVKLVEFELAITSDTSPNIINNPDQTVKDAYGAAFIGDEAANYWLGTTVTNISAGDTSDYITAPDEVLKAAVEGRIE